MSLPFSFTFEKHLAVKAKHHYELQRIKSCKENLEIVQKFLLKISFSCTVLKNSFFRTDGAMISRIIIQR